MLRAIGVNQFTTLEIKQIQASEKAKKVKKTMQKQANTRKKLCPNRVGNET
jgi:hypothetical protein